MLKQLIAGIIVAVTLAGAAVAGPLEKGAAALSRGDYAEAVKWFQFAADQGDDDAQVILGRIYVTGDGVAQDYVLAHMWSHLAAAQGNKGAVENRDIIGGLMTSDQIAEAQRLAREWRPVAEQ